MRLRIIIVACVAAFSLISAGSASAFSKAIWGPATVNGVDQFPLYQKMGGKILEEDLNWCQIAPTKPQNQANPRDPAYKWSADLQSLINEAARYHMKVLLQVIGSPAWANGGHSAWAWAPNPTAYATFAAAAAKEYPSVHLWMVWGEPNRKTNFLPETPAKPGQALDAAQKVAPHNYAKMLDAAYGALKKVSRSNLVIGGSTYTTGDIDTQQWIENLKLPNGKPPRMDIYAHNAFTWEAPAFSTTPSPDGEVQFPDLKRLGQWIDRYLKKGMPIFISEFTMPTQPDQEFNFFAAPPAQATFISKILREARSWPRIYGLGWIHVYDDPPVSYGGLLTVDGTPKPGLAAFSNG